MKKYLAYLLLFALICTACGSSSNTPVSTPKDGTQQSPTLISSTIETKTPAPKPTATALPLADTPTVVLPTEVRIPIISKSELVHFNWNTDWRNVVTWDQYHKDLENPHPSEFTFSDSTEPIAIINQRFPNKTTRIAEIQGLLGVNFFIENVVLVDRVKDQPFHVVKAWGVFPGTDGHNHLYRINFSYDGDPNDHSYVERAIQMLGKSQGVTITVFLTDDRLYGSDPYSSALGGNTPARMNLYNGIIDERTGDDLMQQQSTISWFKTQ